MVSRILSFLLLLSATGCVAEPTDIRVIDYEVTLPPATEVFWCTFGTFEDSVGVNGLWERTESPFLHHQLFKPVLEDVPYADGETVDCLELGDWWGTAPTLLEGVGVPPPDDMDRQISFPPGVAFLMEAGQRYVIDSHWINTTDEVQIGRVQMELGMIPASSVVHEAGTFNFDKAHLSVPPGTWTETVECDFGDQEVNILQLGPHMHAHGTHYAVDVIRLSGETERILEVESWHPSFREDPPLWNWGAGEMVIRPGEIIQTHCTWDNPSNQDLGFPEEMCTSFGAAYPMETNIFCGGSGDGPTMPF